MYIDTETLITAIYIIVDNWYLTEGYKYLTGKPGRKPEFTDSEMITFIILKEFLQFRAERKFLGFMHGNYLVSTAFLFLSYASYDFGGIIEKNIAHHST